MAVDTTSTHTNLYVSMVELWLERGIQLSSDDHHAYDNQKLGRQGEAHFKSLLENFCPDWWTPISDYAFNYSGNSQIDLLLPLGETLIAFEVKNYQQSLSYKGGKASYPNWVFPTDPFASFQRSLNNLRQLIAEYNPNLEVRGAMVFVNPFGLFDLDPELMKNFDFLKLEYRYIKHYLEELSAEFGHLRPDQLISPDLVSFLKAHERSQDEYLPGPLSENQINSLKKGVACKNCRGFELKSSRKKIICKRCSFEETNGAATLRTAQELAIITYGSAYPVTHQTLLDFMSNSVSLSTIHRTLPKLCRYERVSNTNIYHPLENL